MRMEIITCTFYYCTLFKDRILRHFTFWWMPPQASMDWWSLVLACRLVPSGGTYTASVNGDGSIMGSWSWVYQSLFFECIGTGVRRGEKIFQLDEYHREENSCIVHTIRYTGIYIYIFFKWFIQIKPVVKISRHYTMCTSHRRWNFQKTVQQVRTGLPASAQNLRASPNEIWKCSISDTEWLSSWGGPHEWEWTVLPKYFPYRSVLPTHSCMKGIASVSIQLVHQSSRCACPKFHPRSNMIANGWLDILPAQQNNQPACYASCLKFQLFLFSGLPCNNHSFNTICPTILLWNSLFTRPRYFPSISSARRPEFHSFVINSCRLYRFLRFTPAVIPLFYRRLPVRPLHVAFPPLILPHSLKRPVHAFLLISLLADHLTQLFQFTTFTNYSPFIPPPRLIAFHCRFSWNTHHTLPSPLVRLQHSDVPDSTLPTCLRIPVTYSILLFGKRLSLCYQQPFFFFFFHFTFSLFFPRLSFTLTVLFHGVRSRRSYITHG